MERGSTKHSAELDDQMKHETEPIERSLKEPRADEAREKEDVTPEVEPPEEAPSGHRIAGSGSSADEYTYKDWGEVGAASHPKPKDPDERSERARDAAQ